MADTSVALESVTALVIEDHPMMASAIAGILAEGQFFTAIEMAKTLEAALTRLGTLPDCALAITDLNLSDSSHLDCVSAIRERFPDVPLIVYSADQAFHTIESAFELGVRGYVPKTCLPDEILRAVNAVLSGKNYLPDEVTRTMRAVHQIGDAPRLTAKEALAVRYLYLGNSNKEIARQMGVAEGTVKAHLHSVYSKLGAQRRMHVVHYVDSHPRFRRETLGELAEKRGRAGRHSI